MLNNTQECPNCPRLKAEADALRRRIHALEEQLRRGHRQAAPFSRDTKKADPKQPGRKPGDGEFSYRTAPPEKEIRQTEYTPLDRCPDCGGRLQNKRTHETIQTDIPRPEPIHTRFVTESGWCPHCKKRVRSRHPQQLSTATGAAGVTIGPNAKAIAADMHHRLGVPYAKIADHFRAIAGMKVTAGGLCQADEHLAGKLRPVYEELVRAIRLSCVVHADETGWRIGTLSAWLWVFTNRQITVYTISESRGHEVVVEILGHQFKGVLVGDCFLAYDHKDFADWLHQKCFAHFLKTLRQMEADKSGSARRFACQVAGILREALSLRAEKPKLPADVFASRLRQVGEKLDSAIGENRRFSDADNRRFAKRLRKHRQHLFTFLMRDDVDATNNHAERMLRPAVVIRKTGACNKTKTGAQTHSVIASVLRTAKQGGLDAIGYVAGVLTGSTAPSTLLATLDTS